MRNAIGTSKKDDIVSLNVINSQKQTWGLYSNARIDILPFSERITFPARIISCSISDSNILSLILERTQNDLELRKILIIRNTMHLGLSEDR